MDMDIVSEMERTKFSEESRYCMVENQNYLHHVWGAS